MYDFFANLLFLLLLRFVLDDELPNRKGAPPVIRFDVNNLLCVVFTCLIAVSNSSSVGSGDAVLKLLSTVFNSVNAVFIASNCIFFSLYFVSITTSTNLFASPTATIAVPTFAIASTAVGTDDPPLVGSGVNLASL